MGVMGQAMLGRLPRGGGDVAGLGKFVCFGCPRQLLPVLAPSQTSSPPPPPAAPPASSPSHLFLCLLVTLAPLSAPLAGQGHGEGTGSSLWAQAGLWQRV